MVRTLAEDHERSERERERSQRVDDDREIRGERGEHGDLPLCRCDRILRPARRVTEDAFIAVGGIRVDVGRAGPSRTPGTPPLASIERADAGSGLGTDRGAPEGAPSCLGPGGSVDRAKRA